MANRSVALIEALRARKLDRTLTTALERAHVAPATAATGLPGLDVCLRGGLPRGQLSEIAGPRSSGRTTLLLQLIGVATCRGEIAALVDTFDRLEVASAVSAGIDLNRFLWIRGIPEAWALKPGALCERAIERALKALNLVLLAGGFGVVAIDLADAVPADLNRIPFTTWLRIQRTIEGSETACVIIAPQPLARSAGGLTLSLAARSQWSGAFSRLAGLEAGVRIVSPRRRVEGEITIGAQVHGCSGA